MAYDTPKLLVNDPVIFYDTHTPRPSHVARDSGSRAQVSHRRPRYLSSRRPPPAPTGMRAGGKGVSGTGANPMPAVHTLRTSQAKTRIHGGRRRGRQGTIAPRERRRRGFGRARPEATPPVFML